MGEDAFALDWGRVQRDHLAIPGKPKRLEIVTVRRHIKKGCIESFLDPIKDYPNPFNVSDAPNKDGTKF